MKKTYTKKQITEAISYWKNQLKAMNESEDMVTDVNGVTCSSLREYIFKDFEENGPRCINMQIECEEILPYSFSSLSRLPVNGIDRSVYDTIRSAAGKDTYRVFCYYAEGQTVDSEFSDAFDTIDNIGEATFDEYCDPNSEWSKDYGYDEKFAKTFKTEDEWKAYKRKITLAEFESELRNADGLAYNTAADHIFVDDDGIPYCFILWRA